VNLTKLHALAEAATPGPWLLVAEDQVHTAGPICHESNLFAGWDDGSAWAKRNEDAALIAACDPETVKAMIEVIRAAQALYDHVLNRNASGQCMKLCGTRKELVRALAVFNEAAP